MGLFTILFVLFAWTAVGGTVVTSVSELTRVSSFADREPCAFSLTGRVHAVFSGTSPSSSFVIDDGTGRMPLYASAQTEPVALGDRIVASGKAVLGWSTDLYDDILTPELDVTVLAHGPAPDRLPTTVASLARETRDFLHVCVTGTVVEIIRDDIDATCVFLQIKEKNDILLLAADGRSGERILQGAARLLYATVRIRGLFCRNLTGMRIFLGPHVTLSDPDGLEIVSPPIADPYDTPLLDPLRTTDPRAIAAHERGAVVGTVLAVRPGGRLILRGRRDRLCTVNLAEGVAPPACGVCIRLVGRPTTDLYHLNLTHAFWRPEPQEALPPEAPEDLSRHWPLARDRTPLKMGSHGRAMRLCGKVLGVSDMADGFHRLELANGDGCTLSVEAPKAVAVPPVGATVSATGIWVCDIDNWRPDAILPPISGQALVLRGSGDLTVLAQPSLWTPVRVKALIGALCLLLVGIAIWNGILRRLIERRGRELYREKIAVAKSRLKVGERTRLAVELHDALSQTLAGVSLHIDAVEEAAVRNRRGEVLLQLETARLTLKACREELRNCLWDLRNDALDEPDAAQAIRRTVLPHLAGAKLTLRFPVARRRLSDSTFHAVLRIIRELVVNAVRHGKARHLAIAGALYGRTLSFSVQDNGSGFSPDLRPGPESGHFGLQGIQERLDRFGGVLLVTSHPGKGSKVTVRIQT